jgi:hypothetical protein
MGNKEELAASRQDVRRPRPSLARLGEAPEGEPGATAGEPKSVRRPRGLLDIHSSLSRGIHSAPARHERYYLDLYLLQVERGRLTQEAASLGKRTTRIQRRLAEISSEMAEKQQKATQSNGSETVPRNRNRKPPQKNYEYKEAEWKQMPVHY